MYCEPVIRISDLSKCFYLFDKPIHRLTNQLFSRHDNGKAFWALRNVSFEVRPGETVGVIGKNGSGKSTLLEIIAGTMRPTEGDVHVNGRVAALLELGAGFSPEFTGRENALMNAAVMGVEPDLARNSIAEIAEFAEIGDYLDHPVKTYSSGMYVRLAFASAVSFDPDILIIDEALSVGDIRFQRKCFRKFEQLKQQGKTILFVTHSTELVKAHCDKAIFLNDGEVQDHGDVRDVVHAYLRAMFGGDRVAAKNLSSSRDSDAASAPVVAPATLNRDPSIDGCKYRQGYNAAEYRWGDQRARIIDYRVLCGGVADPITCVQGECLEIECNIYFDETIEGTIYGLTVKTVDGITVYGANTRARKTTIRRHSAGDVGTIKFQMQLRLLSGDYFISLGVAADDDEDDNIAVDRRYDLLLLHVVGDGRDFGIADLSLEVHEY
ncbi:MAG: ABC transporter ATP-binding protein [Gammaproteobacteria bacterium]|nr:ABC transporter ATP-binding protein [Gammaproteobacteria bacterium]